MQSTTTAKSKKSSKPTAERDLERRFQVRRYDRQARRAELQKLRRTYMS